VYVGTINGKRHTFQASGSLWQDALVMQDLETETLWSQVSGKGITGPLTGSALTLYPSSTTTYAEFKKMYPEGKLLAKPEKFEEGSPYSDYFSDSTKLGIFGRVDNFKRVPGKTRVIGLRLDHGDVAITVDKLASNKIVVIDKAEPKVVVIFDAETGTGFAYKLAGLSGEQAADVSINGTVLTVGQATWDVRTGSPTDGKSAALAPVPMITAFWFAWASFFPTSDLVQ
jgi:hypothetical protein